MVKEYIENQGYEAEFRVEDEEEPKRPPRSLS